MTFIIEDFWGPAPRVVRPWDLPDRNPMPRLDLFPRLAGLGRRARRLLEPGR